MRSRPISINTDVEVEIEDVLDQLDDDDLLQEVKDRKLTIPMTTEEALAAIIEPFLPDTDRRPSRWLALDIAEAIMATSRYRKSAARLGIWDASYIA